MSGLLLVCLGNGDAFSARRYSSCLAVQAQGAWLLIDCPHPIRKILRESGAAAQVPLDVGDFSAVALTHLHADHASGLEGFLFYHRLALGGPAELLAHPDVAADLWEHHLRISMGRSADDPRAFYELTPLSEDAPVHHGPFAIACRRTDHPIPTFALRITAGGRTLSYSADTSFDPGLIDWLAEGADLIVHETNHGIHTPYERLAELPEALRRRMRLIHFPDDFDTASSAIEPLEQGRAYVL